MPNSVDEDLIDPIGDFRAESVSTKEIMNYLSEHQNYIAITSSVIRSGTNLFWARLEYENFTPDTPDNDDFKFWLSRFGGLLWATAGVPESILPIARKIADECGLEIEEGVPTEITDKGMIPFPFHKARLYCLRNKSGHPCYDYSPEGRKKLEELEEKCLTECQRIFETHRAAVEAGTFVPPKK